MEKLKKIKEYPRTLKLSYLNENLGEILENAGLNDLSYHYFLIGILEDEIKKLKNKKPLIEGSNMLVFRYLKV